MNKINAKNACLRPLTPETHINITVLVIAVILVTPFYFIGLAIAAGKSFLRMMGHIVSFCGKNSGKK